MKAAKLIIFAFFVVGTVALAVDLFTLGLICYAVTSAGMLSLPGKNSPTAEETPDKPSAKTPC